MKPEEDDRENERIEAANRAVRERFRADHRCCGCDGHTMEQRGSGWYCFTCGGSALGCGR